jgi:hypothetical protein
MEILISDLKSPDPRVRKTAAEKLGTTVDVNSIKPLFEALMNWKEDEETLKGIAVALFLNLWGIMAGPTHLNHEQCRSDSQGADTMENWIGHQCRGHLIGHESQERS